MLEDKTAAQRIQATEKITVSPTTLIVGVVLIATSGLLFVTALIAT